MDLQLDIYVETMSAYCDSLYAPEGDALPQDAWDNIWVIRQTLDRVTPGAANNEEPLAVIKAMARLLVIRDLPPQSDQYAVAQQMYKLAKQTLIAYRAHSAA